MRSRRQRKAQGDVFLRDEKGPRGGHGKVQGDDAGRSRRRDERSAARRVLLHVRVGTQRPQINDGRGLPPITLTCIRLDLCSAAS